MDVREKMKGAPPARYVNLARAPARRVQIEAQFAQIGLSDVRRFAAIDGRAGEIPDHIAAEPRFSETDNIAAIACLASHFRLIEGWLEETEEDRLLVLEDDAVLISARAWPFTWKWLEARLPADWDIVQLAVINDVRICFRLHERLPRDWSTAAYLISRPYAQKLMRMHRGEDGRFRFDNLPTGRINTEEAIYGSGRVYSMPVFSYRVDLGSDVHDHHVDNLHAPCVRIFRRFWNEMAPRIENWPSMMDPYNAMQVDQPQAALYLAYPSEGRFHGEPRAATKEDVQGDPG